MTRDAAGHMILWACRQLEGSRRSHVGIQTFRDVRFQDGSPFTAEDVAYTLNRVPRVKNSPASYSIYTKAVTGTEIVDPHTILLHTNGPYPLLANGLGNIFITIRTSSGPDPATEDFNSGKNAIGTGPYRFVSFKPGDRIEMERFDDYWGDKPHWRHVTYRIISSDPSAHCRGVVGRRCWDH